MVSKIKIRFAGDFGEGLEFVEVEDAATGESIDIGEWDHGSGGSTLILSPSDIEDASACPMSGGSDGV